MTRPLSLPLPSPFMHIVAITGGSGFVGRRLARRLLEDHGLSITQVRLCDIQPPNNNEQEKEEGAISIGSDRLKFIQCDLCDPSSVSAALGEGVDTVFHLASYGMSGLEMMQHDRIRAVNIKGTKHIIDACRTLAIPRLLYVSTYNVVFGCEEIINGNEASCSYYPLDRFIDEYSRTKRVAEQMVLSANCALLSTCAIRPAAIYGDGESRHFPRILTHVKHGLGFIAVGSPDTKCDWVYVDNVRRHPHSHTKLD